MILHLEDPKHSPRKFLELINKCSKVAAYKVSRHKSNAFLFIMDESPEGAIRKNTPHNSLNKIKCLGINLPKVVKALYNENY